MIAPGPARQDMRFANLGLGSRTTVLNTEQFRDLLEREVARSDRNDHHFAVVTYNVGALRRASDLAEFVDVIKSLIRTTDEIGWVTTRQYLGVLLADTGETGARQFAWRVRTGARHGGQLVEPQIHIYPLAPLASAHDAEQGAGDEREQPPQPVAAMSDADGADRAAATGPRAEDVEQLLHRRWTWKRAMDTAGAALALVLLSPAMLLVALLIKCVSPGPVIFRQERVGHGGRLFNCLKFRTMHLNSDVSHHRQYLGELIASDAPMTKLDAGRDPRIIPGGGLLRKTGLDELPQLFNVIRGEMSLVGPRPCIPYEFNAYERWHRRRASAMPGLTGLWQVNGKNKTTFAQMIRYDIAYSRKQSPLLDVKIMLKTLPAIVDQVRSSSRAAGKRREGRAEKTRAA